MESAAAVRSVKTVAAGSLKSAPKPFRLPLWARQPENQTCSQNVTGPSFLQADLHFGAEAAGSGGQALGGALVKTLVEALGALRFGGGRKARAQAFGGVGGEGELGNHQQAAAGLADVEVHFAVCIGEHAVVQHFVEQFVAARIVVAAFDAEQNQQAAVRFRRRFWPPVSTLARATRLDQGNHGFLSC